MVSPKDYPEAEQFTRRYADLIAKYRSNLIFLTEPLKGLEGKAFEEAARIKEISERHNFRITEVYPVGNSPIYRVIIGEEHGRPGEEGSWKDSANITEILKEMVSSGFLGAGDEFCYEDEYAGAVDYSQSHDNVLAVGGQKFNADRRFCLVSLLDTFKAAGVKSVCDDDKKLRGIILKIDEDVNRAIDLAEQAKSYEKKSSFEQHAEITSLQRDTVLLERMRRGMADYLARKVGAGKRAVQLMGVIDVFTEVVQDMLKKKFISYIAILPVLGATHELAKSKLRKP